MRRYRSFAAIYTLFVIYATTVQAGRYEQLTKWAEEGPKMSVVAATFFGGAGSEGFVSVFQMKDGTIVACGNAYGPDFSSSPSPKILGKGTYSGSADSAVGKDKRGNLKVEEYSKDQSGFIVFYSPDLKRIKRVLKFDWGVCNFLAVELSQDGHALIATGYCSDKALKSAAGIKAKFETDTVSPSTDGKGHPEVGPSDAYIMRINLKPGAETIEWCKVLKNYMRAPDRIWQDDDGNIFFHMNGFVKISPDGSEFTRISEKGWAGAQAGVRGIDPSDGSYFFGGDRNTNTGQEPWRQPFLYKYDDSGEKVWKLWEWSPKGLRDGVGTDDGLVSDSSIKDVQIAPNGDLLMIGWSDGGNSVFTRQPYDVEQSVGKQQGPFTIWGMQSASSLAYVLRIDPETFEQKAWSYWMAYVPENYHAPRYRGAPNATSINLMRVLENNNVVIMGTSATGLISTPNAFFKYSGTQKYGGVYVAVLKEDFSEVLFSSYLPGYYKEDAYYKAVPTKDGVVIVGSCAKDDGYEPATPPPAINAIQSGFGGGEIDGHIILLRNP